MPRRVVMSDLVTRCQRRADMEGDPSISSAEWKSLISEMYGELYTIVYEAGLEYFEYAAQLTSDGTNVLNEVSDHLSTVTLAYLVDATSGRYRALRELMAQERTIMSGMSAGTHATCFALVDDRIYLYPTPPAGQIYELRYVPQPPDLGTYADAGLVDVVTPDGEALLVWGVTVKALAKSESDVSTAQAEREAARVRFTESVQLRALNAPRRRITDVEIADGESWMWDRWGMW